MTKYQMEVNPEKEDSLRNMILHDSFIIQLQNDAIIRAMRVVGGMLYIMINQHSTFIPFTEHIPTRPRYGAPL